MKNAILVWLLKPGRLKTEREATRDHIISTAIFMAIITLGARLFGMSAGAMASHGLVADVAFNVIVGTIVCEIIRRARPVIYV